MCVRCRYMHTFTCTCTCENGNLISFCYDCETEALGKVASGWLGDAPIKRLSLATLVFTPSSFSALYFNRALRIMLAGRRGLYHHLSPHILHLLHLHPRMAWPWITGAACTQQDLSKVPWKLVELQTTLPIASALKWVLVSTYAYRRASGLFAF